VFSSRKWHIPLFTLLPSPVSVWDEILRLMLFIFELENTHEGCDLLLLKLLVRIADINLFTKPFMSEGVLTFYCRVVLKAV